ncbi:phosphate ABC transporter ATP-binding protein PstB [Nitrincola iocasae]|uniref:Phosphate ABC transporter ATP-binding protein n=1 Tax=Nitrincola iocasae TaxID=2614693 RepID=A0A5J6LJT0_9GAMM|nr:phosphate ABC transporter ATP-binding protein PstB [Nitrincola iocasae]QEW08271.1 phosphate ABC transporter ATP-binding protein [Nitrincola iocasae]
MQPAKIEITDLSLRFGDRTVLEQINLHLPAHQVTAFIGASGCGKSTLLKCINRLNDLNELCHTLGSVYLDGEDIYQKYYDLPELRRRVGMVFQTPNPFPMSIYDNVVFGLRLLGVRKRHKLHEVAERSLRQAALWDEVKDQLNRNANELSGGQQQRLVIARALAVEPDVLMLDEPASALDPISTLKIEELITELKQSYTIVLVTHNMHQAARVSDFTVFLDQGRILETGRTRDLFTNPHHKATEDYITGRYA